MDRKQRLALVQFWLVVSGLRNPLEDDIPSSGEEDSMAAAASNFPPWTASDRNDIAQIHDAYLSKGDLRIPDRPRRAIKEFLKPGDKASQTQYVRARFAILRAQTAVYHDMQKKDFPGFRASDLWYKFLASGERVSTTTTTTTTTTATTTTSSSATAAATATTATATMTGGGVGSAAQGIGILGEGDEPTAGGPPAPPHPRRGGGAGRHSFDGRTDADSLGGGSDDDPLSASAHNLGGNNYDWSRDGDPFLAFAAPPLPPSTADADGLGIHTPESNIVEAMEAALNDIIEGCPPGLGGEQGSPLLGSGSFLLGGGADPSPRSSLDSAQDRPANTDDNHNKPAGKKGSKLSVGVPPPSLASLGLVSGTQQSSSVFKEDLFPEEHPDANESLDDLMEVGGGGSGGGAVKAGSSEDEEEIHQAAPGDLGLAEAIVALTYDIEKLCSQEAVLNSLYRKAELTNNTVELRILRKSKASLQREIRRKELQRQQYIVQESDNSLYVGIFFGIWDGQAKTCSGREVEVQWY